MSRIFLILTVAVLIIHGLIHLMGFVAYWPLATLSELPYKTTVLNGRFNLGTIGIRGFSVLWLITAVGFVIGTVGLLTEKPWWGSLLISITLLSIVITALDWGNAFRGTIISLVILLVVALVWGLKVQPSPLPTVQQQTPTLEMVPVPDDLPAPVARYYQAIAGDEVPVIETAVFNTRGTLRFNGITFPARIRFSQEAGQAYWHDIEATYYGYPLLKAYEQYVDGAIYMKTPAGIIENDPQANAAANLALWAESLLLPSVFVTDGRVRWEPIDEHTARLIVPFADSEDSFIVTFNPETGLIERMKAMRYKDTSGEKVGWWGEPQGWQEVHGILIPQTITITWEDESTPWLVASVEETDFNINLSEVVGQGE